MYQMKSKLQEQLYNKYPHLFADKDSPMTQTCMCGGISCEDGWYELLDKTCQEIMDTNPDSDMRFAQIKEKWGTLTIYMTFYTDEIWEIIDDASAESAKTCEFCGSKENVEQTRKHWIKHLCKVCKPKYEGGWWTWANKD